MEGCLGRGGLTFARTRRPIDAGDPSSPGFGPQDASGHRQMRAHALASMTASAGEPVPPTIPVQARRSALVPTIVDEGMSLAPAVWTIRPPARTREPRSAPIVLAAVVPMFWVPCRRHPEHGKWRCVTGFQADRQHLPVRQQPSPAMPPAGRRRRKAPAAPRSASRQPTTRAAPGRVGSRGAHEPRRGRPTVSS
jgi:hypothetical protein